jgi:hypothetical protein
MSFCDFAASYGAWEIVLRCMRGAWGKPVLVFQFCNTAEILFLNFCNKTKIGGNTPALKSGKRHKRPQSLGFVGCTWLNRFMRSRTRCHSLCLRYSLGACLFRGVVVSLKWVFRIRGKRLTNKRATLFLELPVSCLQSIRDMRLHVYGEGCFSSCEVEDPVRLSERRMT